MLKIHGKSSDIIIGENVSVLGNIDLRNRESGKIIIGNEVAMDTDCRFVSANNAVLRLENGCCLGNNCVFNAGTNITPTAAIIGSSACFILESSPCKNSLFISKVTKKKNIAIKASFIQ